MITAVVGSTILRILDSLGGRRMLLSHGRAKAWTTAEVMA